MIHKLFEIIRSGNGQRTLKLLKKGAYWQCMDIAEAYYRSGYSNELKLVKEKTFKSLQEVIREVFPGDEQNAN